MMEQKINKIDSSAKMNELIQMVEELARVNMVTAKNKPSGQHSNVVNDVML